MRSCSCARQDFEEFLRQTGQLPVSKQLNPQAAAYSEDMLTLRSVASDILALKSQLGLDDTPQDVSGAIATRVGWLPQRPSHSLFSLRRISKASWRRAISSPLRLSGLLRSSSE